MCPCDTWTMEKVTHGKMNSRVRGSFLSLERNQTIGGEGEKKRKGRKRKEKEERKEKGGKKKKEIFFFWGGGGECVIWERGEKKKEGTTLPLSISGEPAVETHWGKRQSWSMR